MENNIVAALAAIALYGGSVAGLPSSMASGTWWWDGRLAVDSKAAAERLDFLAASETTEIYLWPHRESSTDEIVRFVRAAKSKGMRTAFLCGDVSWIEPGSLGFDETFARFRRYQKSAPEDARFFAIHLDVEPHQNHELPDARKWQLYADFVARACAVARKAGEKIEWDIPFWLDNIKVFRNADAEASLLSMIMELSDGVTLMSYRDTAKGMLDVSAMELELAGKFPGCRVLLGAETGETGEGSKVTYYEEGKAAMAKELEKVKSELLRRDIPGGTGVAVHHVGSWMKLKD